MTEFGLIFVLSVIVAYCDFRMTSHNMNVTGNGYGSIKPILQDRSQQPMQYRVLVSWIVLLYKNIFKTEKYFGFYMFLKGVSILFSMSCAYLWFNDMLYVVVMAMFLCAACMYDYTDGYIEVGFYSLFFYLMTVQPFFYYEMIFILIVIATLNRETSLFMVVITWLSGQWSLAFFSSLAFGFGYMLPRVVYSKTDRYCSFNMVRENIRRIRSGCFILEYILFFILLVVVVLSYVTSFNGSPLQIGMGLMFLSLLVPTVWAEIRVFKPIMLIVIPMALG